MAHGRLHLLRSIPGSGSLRPIVRGFCRPGQGIVTAFSDAVLPLCQEDVDESSLIEVLPFGELVRRMLELSGEEALRIAPQGHMTAAIAEACRELPDESPFRRSMRFAGFHEALLSTLKELNEWGLFAEELNQLAGRCEGRLSQKLESLAVVDREMRRLLNLLGLESHARQLHQALDSTPERDGTFERLLCFAGAEESPLKLQWLLWACANGTDVTVVFDRHATNGRVFQGANRALRLLGSEAEEPGEGNRLLSNLFAEGDHGGAPIEVTIASTADPLAEAEWAVRRAQLHDDPEKVSIFCRDLETYAPLLESSANRLGVPLRMARRAPLMTNSLARLTMLALRFVSSDDVRTIAPILQSSYLRLNGEEQVAVASGLKECHQTRDLQWLTLRTWAEQHADRFEWLLKLLEWRYDNVGAMRSLSEWYPRLSELIDHILPVLKNLEGASDYSQERDRRARNQMLRVLAGEASVANAAERGSFSFNEFARACLRLWDAADVSIPAPDFGVCVTSVPECLDDSDTLIVLGMLEGVFPRRRSEDPILTDGDRQAISELRSEDPRLRTSRDTAEEERDVFYRVCARARKQLVLTYPQVDDSRDNVPAFYLELVKAAHGDVKTYDHPRSMLAPPIEDCLNDGDRSLRMGIDSPREVPPSVVVSTEVAQARLKGDEEPVEPGALRDAQTCSFQYLARHRVRLRPRRSGTRWATLRSLPQSATLVKQPNEEEAERALLGALESHLDSLYSEVPGWEMQLLRSGGRRLVAEWVRREFISRRIWPKADGETLLNVGFGTHGVRGELWGGLRLTGVIPALSRIDNTIIAQLYSTGARFADSLTEIDRMYLGIYLAAIHQPGREVAVEMESMSGKRNLYLLTRSGMRPLTSDVNRGLAVVNLSDADDASTAKRAFFEDVKRMVGQSAARIRQGLVETRPGDHCEFCEYGELCRRHRSYGEEDSPFGVDGEEFDA